MIYDEEPEFQFWRLLSRISPSRHRVHKQERQLTRRVSSSEKPELFIVSRTWYRKIFSWNNQSVCSGWKTAIFLLHMLKTSIENNLFNSERPRCYQAPNRRHHPANRKARWTKGCPFPKRGGGECRSISVKPAGMCYQKFVTEPLRKKRIFTYSRSSTFIFKGAIYLSYFRTF